ncbi:MAG: protein translocase subunit SecDF [Breznakibacter sp.]
MQNKGAIRLFAILLAVVSLYQLSFTFFTKRTEKAAKEFAKGDHEKEFAYLDSIANEPVYNFLFLKKYTYMECKGNEINFGLDLKGGMNLILEVKVADIIKALSNHNNNPVFLEAIKRAEAKEKSTAKDFISLFAEEFESIDPQAQLATIFNTVELKELVKYNSSNKEVIEVLRTESEGAISNAFNILRTRIDRFGVTQPNIQRLEKAGRVLVELPGVTDPQRVRKLLQGTASLEFWETYNNSELIQYLMDADAKSRLLVSGKVEVAQTADSAVAPKTEGDLALLNQISGDSIAKPTDAKSLFSYLMAMPGGYGPVVGTAVAKDTADVNAIINNEAIKSVLPRDLKLMWTVKPLQGKDAQGWVNRPINPKESVFQLVAIKVTSLDKRAPLEGDVITNARHNVGSRGSAYEVSMTMNSEGAKTWARLTKANLNRSIAIVLDGFVYSFPTVQSEISGGSSQITGNFTPEEAQDLANILKSGKLPAPARIVSDTVVGPSLGKEGIQAGLLSCLAAFIVVLIYMVFYYNRAGWAANIALLLNLFFIFGVMASFGAVLTLPGLAGITLTLGMAVDANVLIYERIREELRAGKAMGLAVSDGFKHALSAIVDGQLTTLITGIILFIFGTGPIQGFATTLIIGLVTSLFTAIFITRMVFEWMLKKNYTLNFGNKMTNNLLSKTHIDFIGMRKLFYGISISIISIGLISAAFYGFSYGVDFVGGRTYVVRYDKAVNSSELREKLVPLFENQATEVKTFGGDNQVRITTKYLYDSESDDNADNIILEKIFDSSDNLLTGSVEFKQFAQQNVMSSQKVGPAISDDIKTKAIWAVFFSLVGIFLYIFLRFKDWRFAVGGIVSLAHDTLAVIGCFSILRNVMPFSMEIDSAFIAAILTVIGYSINDTVVIYDRIREWREIHPKMDLKTLFNGAMNSTLGRTINTSLTVFFVLLVIFIFGGEVVRGFVFAMLIGVVFGVYSTAFNAAAIVYDTLTIKKNKQKA